MAKVLSLKAVARARSGKGAARSVRREGLVPGVVYGDGKEAELVALNRRELAGHVNTGRFTATLVDLDVGGTTVRVIPREVQFEPVRDALMHVDFLRLGKDARVRVEIAVHFKGHEASPGLKAGGVLNIVRHEIECFCPADNIPDEILIDLTGLHIGQSIHISSIKMPEGVKSAIAERDFTIATIANSGRADCGRGSRSGPDGRGSSGDCAKRAGRRRRGAWRSWRCPWRRSSRQGSGKRRQGCTGRTAIQKGARRRKEEIAPGHGPQSSFGPALK